MLQLNNENNFWTEIWAILFLNNCSQIQYLRWKYVWQTVKLLISNTRSPFHSAFESSGMSLPLFSQNTQISALRSRSICTLPLLRAFDYIVVAYVTMFSIMHLQNKLIYCSCLNKLNLIVNHWLTPHLVEYNTMQQIPLFISLSCIHFKTDILSVVLPVSLSHFSLIF